MSISIETLAEQLDRIEHKLDMPYRYLTIDEAAAELRIGKTLFREKILDKGCPTIRLGTRVLIERDRLYEFIRLFEI